MDLILALQQRLLEARPVLFLAICIYISYRLVRLIAWTYGIRKCYSDIPHLPRHPVWGNLINCGEKLAGNRHPDYGFEEIWESMDRPSCFLMDLAPVDKAFLIVAEPHITEIIVNPSKQYKYSVPKSDTFVHLSRLIGSESLITHENEEWKALRKRFNPGFQPKHLYSLTPSVVAKTKMFIQRLELAAGDGRIFTLADYAKDLTTDIITQLTIERDMHAQSTPEGQGEKGLFGMLTASGRLSELAFKSGQGLRIMDRINIMRPIKAAFYEYVFDKKLSAIISAQMNSLQHTQDTDSDNNATTTTTKSSSSSPTKSIAQLAMATLPPSSDLVRNTVHQIKTFLFAGQDTTATLVQWLCYEMYQSPAVLAQLRAEHDAVFGTSSPFSAATVLSELGEADRILGSQLPYTTAVVKEALRLHPPAATARYVPPETPFEIDIEVRNPTTGKTTTKSVDISGLRIYPSQWLIHRNASIWGPDAHVFNPSRWLDTAYMSSLPTGSFRPFERGPRNCIGQDLAIIEGKVLLAMVARGFAFEKVGLTGKDGEDEVSNGWAVTSVPIDGMRMRVRREV